MTVDSNTESYQNNSGLNLQHVVAQQSARITRLRQEIEMMMKLVKKHPALAKQQPGVLQTTMVYSRASHLGLSVASHRTRPIFPRTNYGPAYKPPVCSSAKKPIITKIAAGSPADRSGLVIGDVVMKVNGKELANASHEETVKAFHAAEEPILVEVLRRPCNTNLPDKSKQITEPRTAMTNTIGTQTEPIPGCYCHQMFTIPAPPPVNSSVDIDADDFSADVDCDRSEVERPYEWEYEEILLHKSSSTDKIGLTVFYEPTCDDGISEIYVGKVEPDSLAGRDGRIQEGDLIVKINNCEVKNRQQAIQLFSENRSDISLLICRPAEYSQVDDEFDKESQDSHCHSFSTHDHFHMQDLATMPLIEEERSEYEDDSTVTDTATLPSLKEKEAKDSGVGHDSPHSSEQECDSSHYDTICPMEERDLAENFMKPCSNFRQLLEARCTDISQTSIDPVCERLYNMTCAGDFHRPVPRMGTRIMYQSGDNSLPRSESQDTAYNTAESCKSATNTLELTKTLSGSSLSLAENRKNSRNSEEARERRRSKKNEKGSKIQETTTNSTEIAYITEDKLAETMAAQQKLLLKQSKSTTVKKVDQCETSSDAPKMEWVVKRRADGTRYVTRRPVRAKILRERKIQLEKERCGLTTDDDAMSELKAGKHWSKEDRRRHFQKAKEYQQRKSVMQQHLESMKKVARHGQMNILELSQKKYQKHTMKDLEFITVQELLAHRGKISIPSTNVISVTTV